MRFLLHRCVLTIVGGAMFIAATAQVPTRPTDSTRTSVTPPAGMRGGPSTGPKPYKEVITDKAKTDDGMFKVHKIEEKYFFEIGNGTLGRDILVVNRIAKASAGMRNGFFGYAGDPIGTGVIRFEKGPNHKIFLRSVSFSEYSKDSGSAMFSAVNNSNIQPISASFDIKAYSRDSLASVIDMTDYINGDNDILFFSSGTKSSQRIGMMQSDKSYALGVKSFPMNIEINTVKTYSRSPAPPSPTGGGRSSGGGTGNITVELNSSLVMLPKDPMPARYIDPRVGYFQMGYIDFDLNPQGVKSVTVAKRWRLEPKDADIEKYKRGELVEPKKPIIFYIDPATPKKWIPYLIKGVNDWQTAFEAAGFKNAIMAKTAPTKEEDPEWSLEDARYSAIVYKPSDVANASGPSIADPRSGEILESHINWYHNVMELLRNWYFVQASPIDPRARKMTFDDELMGDLIRFVSSHEVGHTLGLRHNYGSSSSVPVENLRNKAWVEANGHTPSIMDYARFNYVAQPEDNITAKGIYPRIGDYDKWAIDWGYRYLPQFKGPEEEKEYLNKWVIEKLKDKRLWFGTELNPDDPRSQNEQVGDDAMKGSMYGIKNLQRIVPNLIEWTKEPNEVYTNLDAMYREVRSQFSRYMGHVAKYVGGIMETPKTVEEAGPVYEIVSKAKQKEAVEFINKNLFVTPTWLINQEIFSRTGGNAVYAIGALQDNMINRLLSSRNFSKLIEAEAAQGSKSYTILELLGDMKRGIYSELAGRKSIDVYRRNLQKSYVNALINIVAPEKPSGTGLTVFPGTNLEVLNLNKSDVISVVRAHLVQLKAEITAAAAGTADAMSKYHLQDVAKRIDNALNSKD